MIYFDNAATTFPKPGKVVYETERCLREYCGNPGRGAHRLSLAAAEKIYECRTSAAELFNAGEPENVVFTMNTTYALNTAIKSSVKKGDHVLISSMEHNSVLRPVVSLAEKGVITYGVFDAFAEDCISEIEKAMKPNTTAVICAHASNICGRVLPIGEIGGFLKKKGIKFIVDCAQSAGKIKIDMAQMNIDALCVPGHKGLYGIQGGAMMICSKNFGGSTFIEGGGGINSLDMRMPDFLPERYEAGTLPTPCIAALNEGIRFVRSEGIDYIREKEEHLFRKANERLRNMRKIRMYSDSAILLFNIEGVSSAQTAYELDRRGICVRSGFHCTPMCHKCLKTGDDGAVRVSFGVFNTEKEVIRFCDEVNRIASRA